MRTRTCSKCQGTMVEGFLPVEKHGARAVTGWIEGPPQKVWWGLRIPGKAIEVQTWRCQRCGFLEHYANG